jgi:hypothetical protein
MKIGIAAAPSIGSAGAYPGRLVEIQHCATEEEQWAEDEIGEKQRRALVVVSLAMEEQAQRVSRHPDDHDERRE